MADPKSNWRQAQAAAPARASHSLRQLEQALAAAGLPAERLECARPGDVGTALVADAQRTGEALAAAGHEARPLARAEPEGERLVAVSAETGAEALRGLAEDLIAGAHGEPPAWLAIDADHPDPSPLLAALERHGLYLAEGRIRLDPGAARESRFDLYRTPAAAASALARTRAVYPEKRGEGPGHLEGREDYFQKRHETPKP